MNASLLADLVASAREGLRDDWEWKDEVVTDAIVTLAAERDALLALVIDGEAGGGCEAAAVDPSSTSDECDGGYDSDGSLVSDVCWEHRRRALLASAASASGRAISP